MAVAVGEGEGSVNFSQLIKGCRNKPKQEISGLVMVTPYSKINDPKKSRTENIRKKPNPNPNLTELYSAFKIDYIPSRNAPRIL
jgi:hypothetical protein